MLQGFAFWCITRASSALSWNLPRGFCMASWLPCALLIASAWLPGYKILHFNKIIICESGDLTGSEILNHRNSGGNFMALAFLTKLRSNQLKPHSHLLLMILVFLAMILILSVLVLNSNNSRNFGWWPFRMALYILAVLWYNWPSIGGALTRWGTWEDRAIFGSPHNLWNTLRHVEQKLLMWEASSARAWDPYM